MSQWVLVIFVILILFNFVIILIALLLKWALKIDIVLRLCLCCELVNMAAKMRLARLESEIDKCRTECNWSKALDLARQISAKSPALGIYAYLF